jgi:hypothetical protein
VHSIELSDKQLTYIILALESYAKDLMKDEEDAGPSMADSLFVADLAKHLRRHVPTNR